MKVPLCPKPQLVEAYRREMEAMVRDPQRVRRLGQAAQEIDREHEFTGRTARA